MLGMKQSVVFGVPPPAGGGVGCESTGLAQSSDEGALLAIVRSVIDANADAVAQYRAGKMQTFGFLWIKQIVKIETLRFEAQSAEAWQAQNKVARQALPNNLWVRIYSDDGLVGHPDL